MKKNKQNTRRTSNTMKKHTYNKSMRPDTISRNERVLFTCQLLIFFGILTLLASYLLYSFNSQHHFEVTGILIFIYLNLIFLIVSLFIIMYSSLNKLSTKYKVVLILITIASISLSSIYFFIKISSSNSSDNAIYDSVGEPIQEKHTTQRDLTENEPQNGNEYSPEEFYQIAISEIKFFDISDIDVDQYTGWVAPYDNDTFVIDYENAYKYLDTLHLDPQIDNNSSQSSFYPIYEIVRSQNAEPNFIQIKTEAN